MWIKVFFTATNIAMSFIKSLVMEVREFRIEDICLVEYEYEYANQVTDVKC